MHYKEVLEKFPFLCICKTIEGDYLIGIVQNKTKDLVNIYILNNIKSVKLKKKFLTLGDIWWTESNRKIPINIFLKEDFTHFKRYLYKFTTKEITIIDGYTLELKNIFNKNIKRKIVKN